MKLCVYAICKNEKQFLSKWFENMFEADYICVLDTGSTDGTYKELQKLQKQYPQKVIISKKEINPWRFDVARNESLKLVPEDAEILICVDLDELFTTYNWVEKIKTNWLKGITNRCYYNYAWSHNNIGECTDMFIYDKCHTKDLHWIFPVHEVLWPVNEKTYKENAIHLENELLLEHFQDKNKKRTYYFDLLKLAVEENPDNPHERMLLAREYLINKQYNESLNEYLKTLEMPKIDRPEYRLVLLESLGRCADLYKLFKNYDEAIWYAQEWIKEDYTYREPYFLLAEMYNDMKMYTLAEATAEAGFKYGTRKYTWVERAPTWVNWGEVVLGFSKLHLKRYDEALIYINKSLEHDPDNIELLKNKIICLEQKYEKDNISE